jgi:hypothetical protein
MLKSSTEQGIGNQGNQCYIRDVHSYYDERD